MAERKAISKRMRFEVLKRDSFTCQYCGKQPPDTVLHLDHIKPVSKGGKNTMLNLVTSCVDCNLGKSDVELSDDSAIKKQQSQLKMLAEKKAQVSMMVEWRESLLDYDDLLTESLRKIIDRYLEEDDKCVADAGIPLIRKAIKKHGYQKAVDSIESLYASGKDFSEGWSAAIRYCSQKKGNSIHYIKGILKNKCYKLNEKSFYAAVSGVELSDDNYNLMVSCAKESTSLQSFLSKIEGVL